MIPFTAEVYFRLVAQYNAAIWPLQLVALVLGLIAIWLALRPRVGGDRIIAWILASAWLWTAVVFHVLYLATLMWAAWGFAVLFALQGLLFALAGLRGSLRFRFSSGLAGWCGLAIVALAAALDPLAALLAGQDWSGLRPFALAPAPLTLFTFGLLTLAVPSVPRHLLMIPILWSVIAGAAAWELAIPQDLILPVVALAALGVALRRSR